MTTYTDEEIDKVALAILNSDLRRWGHPPMSSVEQSISSDDYRCRAEAAIAARDALFEVTHQAWAVRCESGLELDRFGSKLRAKEVAATHSEPNNPCRVIHVTTKRRKR